ncbi:phage holin family protein [Nodosilinea sp. LEGE 06152]|uniref:phage holin family protein n=1 Tax=Nodosilinea sp. LEGE 06152 TaxID=2777966 RepID=UPI00187EECBB|nr:phage holin family protein [Nodosilinea sp. LEGE 06152]MBE9158051.1 phage holin family protein [Nodosilinea sp. LEGE 06152]
MWSIFLSGLATALSLLVVDLVVPGITINTITAAAIAAGAVGIVNAFVKPFLQTLTLPINTVSFGAFSLFVNGLCLWLASLFVPGFYVTGIIGFLVGPIVLSAVNTFLGNYLDKKAPAFMKDGSELNAARNPSQLPNSSATPMTIKESELSTDGSSQV